MSNQAQTLPIFAGCGWDDCQVFYGGFHQRPYWNSETEMDRCVIKITVHRGQMSVTGNYELGGIFHRIKEAFVPHSALNRIPIMVCRRKRILRVWRLEANQWTVSVCH